MRFLKPALCLLLALAALLAWPAAATDLGVRPDFLLLYAVGAGLFGREGAGLAAGVAAGLLAAPLSLDPFGLDAALLGASGIVAAKAGVYLRGEHPGVQGALAGLLALAAGVLRLLLLEVSGTHAASLSLLPAILAGAAATAAAAPVALFLLDAGSVFRARRDGGRLSLV